MLFDFLVLAQALTGLPIGLFMAIGWSRSLLRFRWGFRVCSRAAAYGPRRYFTVRWPWLLFGSGLLLQSKLVVCAVLHLCLDSDVLRFSPANPNSDIFVNNVIFVPILALAMPFCHNFSKFPPKCVSMYPCE